MHRACRESFRSPWVESGGPSTQPPEPLCTHTHQGPFWNHWGGFWRHADPSTMVRAHEGPARPVDGIIPQHGWFRCIRDHSGPPGMILENSSGARTVSAIGAGASVNILRRPGIIFEKRKPSLQRHCLRCVRGIPDPLAMILDVRARSGMVQAHRRASESPGHDSEGA